MEDATADLFDFKPQIKKSCDDFADKYTEFLSQQVDESVLRETVSSNENEVKSRKRKFRRVGQEIAAVEKKSAFLIKKKQKFGEQLSDVKKHEVHLWTVLHSHVIDTAMVMQKIKGIQEELAKGTEEENEMEEHVKRLQEKVNYCRTVRKNWISLNNI